jgi:hypothetical protein
MASIFRSSLHRAVTPLLSQAGAKNTIGSTFAELAGIIRGVEDKSRVGVCLDTCLATFSSVDQITDAFFFCYNESGHAFAAVSLIFLETIDLLTFYITGL